LKSTDRFLIEGVACTVHGHVLPVVNLSVGGFFVASTTPPPVGELMELDLSLDARPPFRVTAKVVWVNEAAEPRAAELPRGFGVKITKIALPDKIAIVDFLKRAKPARPRVTLRSR